MCDRNKHICGNCYFENDKAVDIFISDEDECIDFVAQNPEIAQRVVEDYMKENPLRTNRTEYGELFKNEPWRKFYKKDKCDDPGKCFRASPCDECDWWNQVVEE